MMMMSPTKMIALSVGLVAAASVAIALILKLVVFKKDPRMDRMDTSSSTPLSMTLSEDEQLQAKFPHVLRVCTGPVDGVSVGTLQLAYSEIRGMDQAKLSSPELKRCIAALVDHKADIFAFFADILPLPSFQDGSLQTEGDNAELLNRLDDIGPALKWSQTLADLIA